LTERHDMKKMIDQRREEKNIVDFCFRFFFSFFSC
jgi:hypothetical protein